MLLPPTKKIWTLLGPKFGKDKGHKAIVVRALYGLSLLEPGAVFQSRLANCMRHHGYESNKANSNIWMKVSTRENSNRPNKYYSYMSINVDDILCINDDSDSVPPKLGKYFLLKPDPVGEPDVYLQAKLKLMQLKNGVWAWGMGP